MNTHYHHKLMICAIKQIIFHLILLCLAGPTLAGGKLLATPGVAQIEGSGGGGIVPWAQLAGYATEDQIAGSGFCSRADLKNFSLNVCGAQLNIRNRLELSYAQQTFFVPALDTDIRQSITSAKIRLYGDIVYSHWPQVSLGLQHKSLRDSTIAMALGAQDDSDTDVYLAASKLHLGSLFDLNSFWNVTLRHTQANQLGLLGFGGVDQNKSLFLEASAALFISSQLAVGFEFRQKPDNLNLGEDHWNDIFIAWFPNKHINVTASYLELGSIAGTEDQTGWYLSIMGNL